MNHREIFSESTTVLTLRTLALFDYREVSVYSPSETVTEVITIWDCSEHTHTYLIKTHICNTDTSTNLKIVRIFIPLLFCVFCGVLLQIAWMTRFYYLCLLYVKNQPGAASPVYAWIMIKKQVREEVNVKWEGFQRMSNNRLTWRNQRQHDFFKAEGVSGCLAVWLSAAFRYWGLSWVP